jgi:hypothetical protein
MTSRLAATDLDEKQQAPEGPQIEEKEEKETRHTIKKLNSHNSIRKFISSSFSFEFL